MSSVIQSYSSIPGPPGHLTQMGEGTSEVPMPEQGRANSTGLPPIDMSWCFPDPDTSLTVYVLVSAPIDVTKFDPRDLHWSLSWEVQPNVWRHINVLYHERSDQPAPNPRLVFWGPLTKMGDIAISGERRVPVAVMTREMRKRIEELAWTVPVIYPNGQWNCQNWLVDLLGRMQDCGLITDEILNKAIDGARNAHVSENAK
ncbi:hypothetical protein ACG7TL_001244 [Trametes sanguinea]